MWKLLCLLSALAAPLEARHQSPQTLTELYDTVAQEVFKVIPHSSSVPIWQFSPPSTFACERQGYFPHPLHCQYFYKCAAFAPSRLTRFLHRCDIDRIFSAESQTCVVPLDGYTCPGWDGQAGTDLPSDSVTKDDETTTAQSLTTQDDSVINEQSQGTPMEQVLANVLDKNAGNLNDGSVSSNSQSTLDEQNAQNTASSLSNQKQPADDTQVIATTTEMPTCDSGHESSDCVDEGFYGVPEDCSKFYRCISFGFRFVKYEFLCPAGTIWDDSLKTCNFRVAVAHITCKDKSQSVTPIPPPTSTVPPCPDCDCPVRNVTENQKVIVCPSGFREHQTYCNMFYQCYTHDNVDVNYVLFLCPNDTVFDMENLRCVNDEARLQSCEIFKPSNTQYGNRILQVNPWNTDLCPGQGRFPYDESCSNRYISCDYNDRGKLEGHLYKCPPEQLFSIIKDECMSFSAFPYCSRDSLN